MRIKDETFIDQKDMRPDAVIIYLRNALDRAIDRESDRARVAASLSDLLVDLLYDLVEIEMLHSCKGVAQKHISRSVARTRRIMEQIENGSEYHARSFD